MVGLSPKDEMGFRDELRDCVGSGMKQLGFSFSEGESKLLGLREDSIPTPLALYSWAYSTSIKSDWD